MAEERAAKREPEVGTATSARTDRRQQLIDSTLTAIAEYGLSKTTLAKVSHLAGLSPGIVNFYFNSKDALLLATIRYLAEEFEASVESAIAGAGTSPVAALEAIIDASFDPLVCDVRKVAVWYAFWGESRARAEYLQVCGEKEDAYYRTIIALCQQIIDEGRHAHLDAEAVSRGFIGLMDGLWQDILEDPVRFDRDAARRTCRAYLASVFPAEVRMPHATAEPVPPVEAGEHTSVALPGWTYADAELHALEREQILLRGWQVACHAGEIPRAGDYATLDFPGARAFVVRDERGAVRAFHNACRHRGHAVVEGRVGHCQGFMRCPYHGWAYDFDGRLRAVPDAAASPDPDGERVTLISLDVEVFLGLVFVRVPGGAGPAAPGVAVRLARWLDELSAYRIGEMLPLGDPRIREVDADWKCVMDNHLDDYRFPGRHPGLAGLLNDDGECEVDAAAGIARLCRSLRPEAGGCWSERRYHRLLPAMAHLPPELRRRWSRFSLFPAMNLDLHPERVDCFQVLPLGPGRSLLCSRSYVLPDAPADAPGHARRLRAVRWLGRRIGRRAQDEDVRLACSAQRGLTSSGWHGWQGGGLCGRETAVRGFHEWLRAHLAMPDPSLPPHPS